MSCSGEHSSTSRKPSQNLPGVLSTATMSRTASRAQLCHVPSQVSCSSFSESQLGEEDGEPAAAETYAVGEYNLSACPICLERFTLQNPAIIVKCEHGFHLQCLEAWRMRSTACPVCLKPLSGDEGRLMGARDTRRRRRHSRTAAGAPNTLHWIPAPEGAVENIEEDAERSPRKGQRGGPADGDVHASGASTQFLASGEDSGEFSDCDCWCCGAVGAWFAQWS